MAPFQFPRDDPAIQDFDNELKLCTLKTPNLPIACGRPYVRVSRLSKWFDSLVPREDGGSSVKQARRLLDYAYRDWPEHTRTNIMPTHKLFDADAGCIIIFSILLKMGRGCLIHLFRSQQKFDRNLPISHQELVKMFYAMLKPASEHRMHFDPAALANEFDDLQWQFCPAKFELEEELHFDQRLIVPIIEKSILSDKGGTAKLWQIAVLEEFVNDKLAAAVPSSRYDVPEDGLGPRFNFALKIFKEGHRQSYENEVDAFRSLPHHGMIRYLFGYTHEGNPQAGAPHLGTSVSESHQILLEFGECDLGTVFDEEMLPLVLQADIDLFWNSLFVVARTLAQIHHLTQEADGVRREFWGWHADIKPSNILEIEGEFKLADPGFAKFMKKEYTGDTRRPTARLEGGTSTYSAPEQISRSGANPEFHQTIDVWALGCVFSEAATWVALGHQGVRQYARLREKANLRALKNLAELKDPNLPRLEAGDYFHDGRDVLPEVTDWHQYLRNILRGTDRLTKHVLDIIENCMLLKDPLDRWQSFDIYEKFSGISASLGGRTSTVPPSIVDFLSSTENATSPPQGSAHHRTIGTLKKDPSVTQPRRDKRSRYLYAPIPDRPSHRQSRMTDAHDRSPIAPETKTPSRIASGPIYESPTHSATFAIDEVYDRLESFHGQQVSEEAHLKSPGRRAFRGKIQDIFQAFKENEERERSAAGKVNKLNPWKKKMVDDYLAKYYVDRDIKFLVDNSSSMHKHWAKVEFVLKTLALKAKGLDADGVDLYFTLGGVKAEKKTGVKPLMDAMANADAMPSKESDAIRTDMATRLKDMFDEHLRVTKSRMRRDEKVTKLTIIVLTDGMWDVQRVARRIEEFAGSLKELTKTDIDDRPVSIQFIQFGRNTSATKGLIRLDDDLKSEQIPDLVDAEHSDGNIYKMLLGSFVEDFDELTLEEDEATLWPISSNVESYYEERQSTMSSTSNQPAPQLMANPSPFTLGSGPPLQRQPSQVESHVPGYGTSPHRRLSQRESLPPGSGPSPHRQPSQRESLFPGAQGRGHERRLSATSYYAPHHQPHHQPSSSRDSTYH